MEMRKIILRKLKKELGLEKEIELIYKTSEQEKVALIEQSDVFVMPSVVYKKSVEGFGITYIEAASYGKPSIGGIYGGEGDAIKSGQTGYLCNGNDLNVLYDTLLKTLDKRSPTKNLAKMLWNSQKILIGTKL
jgi:phosphatidylinositol alpha-1,6-mannosyltransferase